MKVIARIHPAGVALTIGGALWLLSGLRFPMAAVVGVNERQSLDWGPYVLAPAALLILAGLAGLLVERLSAIGKTGLFGLAGAGAGCIAIAGVALAGSGRGDSALAPGLLLLSAGLIAIGSRLLAERVRRGWRALPLLLGLLGLLLPMGAGVRGAAGMASWVVFGIGWLWLGGVVMAEASAPAKT